MGGHPLPFAPANTVAYGKCWVATPYPLPPWPPSPVKLARPLTLRPHASAVDLKSRANKETKQLRTLLERRKYKNRRALPGGLSSCGVFIDYTTLDSATRSWSSHLAASSPGSLHRTTKRNRSMRWLQMKIRASRLWKYYIYVRKVFFGEIF